MAEERILSLPFKFFFANAAAGMVLTDFSGKIIVANAAFAALVGHPLHEIGGQSFLSFVPVDRNKRVREVLEGLVANTHQRYAIETSLIHRNGQTLSAKVGAALAQDAAGRPLCTILTLTEIPTEDFRHSTPARASSRKKSGNGSTTPSVWHDAVTGLNNHLLFREQLRHAISKAEREDKKLGVLVVDLDGFKELNNSFGHPAGDQLLKDAGERIAACLRKSDAVARYDGDQYAILLEGLNQAEHASAIAQKLLQAFVEPFRWRDHEVYLSPSIGISIYPVDGVDTESLMKNARSAAHQTKKEGGNAFQFYTEALNIRAMERIKMISDLHRALSHEEFILHYQPLVNASSEKVICLEALLRWNHPEKGLMPPLSFIPMLEETGLIVPAGNWILRTACRQIKALRRDGYHQLRVAVNISPRQFSQKDFASNLVSILEETGLEPAALQLEITESVLVKNTETNWKTLQSLTAQGISISLDDFGTGCSSLSYLKQFPIHILKIDRDFVRGIPKERSDVAITNAILALATSLGLRVVAEGVETQDQIKYLRERDCQELQGFFFARPMPSAELADWLNKRSD